MADSASRCSNAGRRTDGAFFRGRHFRRHRLYHVPVYCCSAFSDGQALMTAKTAIVAASVLSGWQGRLCLNGFRGGRHKKNAKARFPAFIDGRMADEYN